MITVPILSCQVRRDMTATIPKLVPAHELALMTVKFGEGNVNDVVNTGETRDYDVADEFDRLTRMYGRSKDKDDGGRSWVDITFGRIHEGRMETTMQNAAKHYAPADVEPEEPPKRKRPSRSKAAVAARAAAALETPDEHAAAAAG